ncbi:DUF397 domain-containing protein [Nonomuraea wenchangensis]|uniref:DUF397 domain-containing protein n=1 Tax=Nonomuraea wenchangensis TaxID=568860 RepID=UPI00331891E1
MTAWRKSSFCNAGSCVEVQTLPDGTVAVRDGKDPDGPVLRFTYGEWCAFVGGILAGEFDPATLAARIAGDGSGGSSPARACEAPVARFGAGSE